MTINLNHLAVFHAVAQAGSMTQGAKRLDISQPAASKQVRQLEKAVGVHLFDRIGRRVPLNQAGVLLAEYAGRLFGLAREAEQALAKPAPAAIVPDNSPAPPCKLPRTVTRPMPPIAAISPLEVAAPPMSEPPTKTLLILPSAGP
jgi:DNA-binding transcriptional LysR family regulator